MAHEIETMMYVGETPWHGLGVKLDSPPTIAEALIQAGLNWYVDSEQLMLADGTLVDRWANVRRSDRKVLGTVGAGYHLFQNDSALNFFDPFIQSGEASLHTAGSLRGGSRVWVLAKLNKEDSVIVAKSDDRVAKYLLLAHSHDGTLKICVMLTPTRVVCQNTLSAALTGSHHKMLKIKHTMNAGRALSAIQDTVEQANNDFEKVADVFRALANVNATEHKIRQYVDLVWPRKATEKEETGTELLGSLLSKPLSGTYDRTQAIVERAERKGESRAFDDVMRLLGTGRGADMAGVKGTAWGAYNAVTELLTWESGRTEDNRLNNLWFQSDKPALALQAAQQVFLT